MKRVSIAIAAVIGVILLATYLLAGTGILSSSGGIFIRVLVGFTLLFVSVQIACYLDRKNPGDIR